jgi:glycosyltransferase involved in cell wall biosynthesis
MALKPGWLNNCRPKHFVPEIVICSPIKASIVIPTKNRKDYLRRAVASAVLQCPEPEIILMDDGSTDGSSELVRSEFPQVKVHRFDQSRGSSVRRNQAVRLATGDIIVSIDDDAEFSTPKVVAQTVAEFDDPRVGAVAIPYIDVKVGPTILHQPPALSGVWVTSGYAGTAAAWRKDIFLALGGYSELVLHMSEERDFCMRLLDAGFVVKLGRANLIRHYQSPVRVPQWNRMMQRRNDLIHTICNVPFPEVLPHFMGTILSGLIFGVRNRCVAETIAGYCGFLRVFNEAMKSRNPVSRRTYYLFRELNHRGFCKLEEIERRLAPLAMDPISGDKLVR